MCEVSNSNELYLNRRIRPQKIKKNKTFRHVYLFIYIFFEILAKSSHFNRISSNQFYVNKQMKYFEIVSKLLKQNANKVKMIYYKCVKHTNVCKICLCFMLVFRCLSIIVSN